jgi:uroporphyrinogen-III synthase
LEVVEEGNKVVVAGACKRRGLIESSLAERGVQVFSWNLYKIIPSAPDLESVRIISDVPSILWTFFSGSAVSAYAEWRELYSLPKLMPHWYFAAFGESTAAAMRKYELPPCVVHCGGSHLAFCDLLVARFS